MMAVLMGPTLVSRQKGMTQELFNGWLIRHFAMNIPPNRPVCLLVDKSHMNLEISTACEKKNGILLYCLPLHSSHITQP